MPDLNIRGPIVRNDVAWIYEWLGMECCCPSMVLKAIAEANGEPLTVYLSSPGGEISSGSDIYTALRSYAGGVHIVITGSAHSAASVIAMAGESEMASTALMMIHNVSEDPGAGDYQYLEHEANVLRTASRAMASAYVQKTGLPEAEILQMMDNETWMTAEEAVEKGFVDKVMFKDEETKEINPLNLVASCSCLLPQEVLDKVRMMRAAQKDMETAQARMRMLSLVKI